MGRKKRKAAVMKVGWKAKKLLKPLRRRGAAQSAEEHVGVRV
jgi:hypothetical protein